MNIVPGVVSTILAALMWCGVASASSKADLQVFDSAVEPEMVQLAEGSTYGGNAAISEDEAANIAQGTQPGAKVLKVKLLPSGVYAVTLKEGGNVSRVMVDAKTGAVL